MATNKNKKIGDVRISTAVLSKSKNTLKDNSVSISLKDLIDERLSELGVITKPVCCDAARCYYDMYEASYSTLESIVVDGVTLNIGGTSVGDAVETTAFLNSLGLGLFTVDVASGKIYAPASHSFGNLTIGEDTIAITCS